MKLFAPQTYWNMTETARNEIAGGCGSGKVGDWLVPDTIYGLNVKKACRIHDVMYFLGTTNKDKKAADRVFLNNMLRIIKGGTKWWLLRRLRILRAYTYYKAVKRFGARAFWHNKNSDTEFKDGRLA